MWQRATQQALMQQELAAIAADLTAGTITIGQAVAQSHTAAIRIGTMYLMLGFPLEDRMN